MTYRYRISGVRITTPDQDPGNHERGVIRTSR